MSAVTIWRRGGNDRLVAFRLCAPLAQLRAGQAEIKAIREASGYEAHYREAEDLARQAREVGNQRRVTLAGAIAMLELGAFDGGCLDRWERRTCGR